MKTFSVAPLHNGRPGDRARAESQGAAGGQFTERCVEVDQSRPQRRSTLQPRWERAIRGVALICDLPLMLAPRERVDQAFLQFPEASSRTVTRYRSNFDASASA